MMVSATSQFTCSMAFFGDRELQRCLAERRESDAPTSRGSFPNAGGLWAQEQNDEWSLNRRYMQIEDLHSPCDTVPTRLRSGSLSGVQLSLSGLWTYTTSRDTTLPLRRQPPISTSFAPQVNVDRKAETSAAIAVSNRCTSASIWLAGAPSRSAVSS